MGPRQQTARHMKRVIALTTFCGLAVAVVAAQQTTPAPVPSAAQQQPGARGRGSIAAEPETLPLWTIAAPGALGDTEADRPTLTMYATGGRGAQTAVIIAPGGAYANLALNHEGRQWANWFNAQGVTAFVLKYRLGPRYRHPIPLSDAQRALRLVRARAAQYGYDASRIGMMGFSAGGHLTATAGTRFDSGTSDATDPIDRQSSRPDFMILAYPVISFQPEIAGTDALRAYANSGRNLLGDNAPAALLRDLSAETQVSAQTPPTFMFHTSADALVPPENSIAFYAALRRVNVPVEIHVFERGAHGVGMGLTDPALSAWPTLLMNWMRQRGLLTAPPTAP
jgi:acetyl esterase/lipase